MGDPPSSRLPAVSPKPTSAVSAPAGSPYFHAVAADVDAA